MPDPQRAAELRALGYQAYRQGNYPRARQHFERALSLVDEAGADAATAHSDLGATAASAGDHAAALRHHEAALQLRRSGLLATDLAATLHNLGATYRALGRFAEAEASHQEAVRLWRHELGDMHPMVARGLSSLGTLARLRGELRQALALHGEALRIHAQSQPRSIAGEALALGDLAAVHAQEGDFAAAENHWRAALGLLQQVRGNNHPSLAPMLNNLGVAARIQNHLDQAADYFAAALAAEPALVTAQHNLAAALSRLGRVAEARRQRDQALARENIFVQQAPNPAALRILILSHADTGNVPLEHIIPERFFTRIWWFPAHGGARKAGAVPAHDIVFNGVGDADMTADTQAVVAAFLRGCAKPVLNHPSRIAQTRRDLLANTLADIDGCVVPKVIRLTPAISVQEQTETAGISTPLLLRPIGAHGGQGVTLIENWSAPDIPPVPKAACYGTPFINCRGTDGFVRKYRIIFVNRVAYPYHLAISADWMVHYFSADMEAHDWKLAEEAAFLADWEAAVGPVAAKAITAIGQRLNLDYCGIDFSVLRDGRALIFEANATMLVHPEAETGPLAFKNAAVAAIIAAMHRLLTDRAAA
jgi:tetratricopeptide (TPR) repeat protein